MISGLDIGRFYGRSVRPYYLGISLSKTEAKVLHACPCPPKSYTPNISFISMGGGAIGRFVSPVKVCIRSLLFGPDVAYGHQAGWTMRAARYVAKLLQRPLVFDVHGSAVQAHDIIVAERAEREAVAAADKIIVVSAGLGDFLQSRFGVLEQQLALVPNGVGLDAYAHSSLQDPARIRTTLGISNNAKVVTLRCPRAEYFPSNEIALRWFFRVIEMLESKRKDITYRIVGGGKIVRPPSSSVLYAGFVPDMPGTLSISDVCVLPYPPQAICGGVRNKALEYFAANKPVVSTTEGMRGIDGAIPASITSSQMRTMNPGRESSTFYPIRPWLAQLALGVLLWHNIMTGPLWAKESTRFSYKKQGSPLSEEIGWCVRVRGWKP